TPTKFPHNQSLIHTQFNTQLQTPLSNKSPTPPLPSLFPYTTLFRSFTITIQGQGGGLTRSTTVSLTVNPVAPPNFTVSASPSSRSIEQRGEVTSSGKVLCFNVFDSDVSLTALNLLGNQVLPVTGFNP